MKTGLEQAVYPQIQKPSNNSSGGGCEEREGDKKGFIHESLDFHL
jgi:hypothetical protein